MRSDNRERFIMELDDSTREDAHAILADAQLQLPRRFILASTERIWWRSGTTVMAAPTEHSRSLTLITAMKRAKCPEGSAPIGWIFRALYASIAFKLRESAPCAILALDTRVHVPAGFPNYIEVTAVGTVVKLPPLTSTIAASMRDRAASAELSMYSPPRLPPRSRAATERAAAVPPSSDATSLKAKAGAAAAAAAAAHTQTTTTSTTTTSTTTTSTTGGHDSFGSTESSTSSSEGDSGGDDSDSDDLLEQLGLLPRATLGEIAGATTLAELERIPMNMNVQVSHATTTVVVSSVDSSRRFVELTPLSYVPGAIVVSYIGRVTLHFIREGTSKRGEELELHDFFSQFIAEANAAMRSHVAALGGDALVCYRMHHRGESGDHKTAGDSVYCMLTVSGDAVRSRPRV